MKKTFGGRIRLLHWCTSQAMNESLAQIGLTSAQGHIMGRLMHSKEHLRARDIEREFCLSHPTVSGILSRLEKKGFIELRPDPADKRCKRIYVLDKASEFSSLMSETIEKKRKSVGGRVHPGGGGTVCRLSGTGHRQYGGQAPGTILQGGI